jgi:AcrR family transcriptional regulator
MTGIAGEQEGTRSHARRNHGLLVAAAREVFAERGAEASLEEIARRAGVGVGTLYRHFATREALVEAVYERRIGELVAVAEAALAEDDGWLALLGLIERILQAQASDRLLKDVLLRSAPGAGRVERAREEMRTLFERVLERARAEGGLREDFAFPDLALLLWSFSPLIDATAEVAPSAWRRHLHWLIEGMRATAATAQSEPPLSGRQLQDASQALRSRRLGRRAASS